MKKAILAFAFLFSAQAYALVDMKNANYSNTWIDMDVPGSGYDLKSYALTTAVLFSMECSALDGVLISKLRWKSTPKEISRSKSVVVVWK